MSNISQIRHRINGLFLLGICSSFLFVYIIYNIIDEVLAIKGGYTAIGFLIAYILLLASKTQFLDQRSLPTISPMNSFKLTLLIASLSIGLLELFGLVTLIYVVFVPVGYSILFLDICKRIHYQRQLTQLFLLFIASAFAKPSTTYFYIGEMDVIKHIQFTNELLVAGSPSGISSQYTGFPGLHINASVLTLVTSISPYEAIVVLGIVTLSSLLLMFYYFLWEYTSRGLTAILTVILVSTSSGYLFFTNYFYPQSLAFAFYFFLLYIALIGSRDKKTEITLLGVILSAAIISTHHLTIILMLPIIVALFLNDLIKMSRNRQSNDFYPNTTISWILIGFPSLFAVYYWGDTGDTFARGLYSTIFGIIKTAPTLAFESGGGSDRFYYLGVAEETETIIQATFWLFGINGIYQSLLVAFISLGTIKILLKDKPDINTITITSLGLIGSILLLDVPLGIKSIDRLAFPLSIFVFFIMASGLKWLLDDFTTTQILSVILLLSLFTITGPLLAVDDVQNYQEQKDPRQAEISKAEYQQLDSTSRFISQYHSDSPASFTVTSMMLQMFGLQSNSDMSIDDNHIRSENPIVYNEQWVNYRQRYSVPGTPYLNYVRMSAEWLETFINRSNKTYDSGKIGIVRTDDNLQSAIE